MPATHIVSLKNDLERYHVTKNGVERVAEGLQETENEIYVHYVGMDKRMDEWVPREHCRKVTHAPAAATSDENGTNDASGSDGSPSVSVTTNGNVPERKRKRGPPPGRGRNALGAPGQPSGTHYSATLPPDGIWSRGGSVSVGLGEEGPSSAPTEVLMTEEDYDIEHHKKITAQRNFDKVHFGEWQVKTWYFSPYPLTDAEEELMPTASSGHHNPKIPGVQKTTIRSHGRTLDLLAGGLGRAYAGPEKANLWVCQQCFKYMADGASYDLHLRHCKVNSPPGEKVYQRGALIIWEVDGSKEKLYCQNLALFGKLFIDVKTLFFDLDNFLFYILTDAEGSQYDHILGFFSKEKVSFDDYNLACIMTLPPYQKKGYGMLMIEFSYELSRRAGKVGTPERPLSDLGLRSYMAYWVATLVRFFRRVLSVMPLDASDSKIETINNFPDLQRTLSENSEDSAHGGVNGSVNGSAKKRKMGKKGWAGENVDPNADPASLFVPLEEPIFTYHRTFETFMDEDGRAITDVCVRCTLQDIARATNLRLEDAAFALNECGLIAHRLGEVDDDGMVVVTRRLVEKVAAERKVKNPCMIPAYVRL